MKYSNVNEIINERKRNNRAKQYHAYCTIAVLRILNITIQYSLSPRTKLSSCS